MGADMDKKIGIECLFQPVIRCQVLVRRRTERIMQDLTDPAVTFRPETPTFWLTADENVTKPDSRDQQGIFMHHPLPGWLTPDTIHFSPELRIQILIPGIIL
jgi:hypothetical protein